MKTSAARRLSSVFQRAANFRTPSIPAHLMAGLRSLTFVMPMDQLLKMLLLLHCMTYAQI